VLSSDWEWGAGEGKFGTGSGRYTGASMSHLDGGTQFRNSRQRVKKPRREGREKTLGNTVGAECRTVKRGDVVKREKKRVHKELPWQEDNLRQYRFRSYKAERGNLQ